MSVLCWKFNRVRTQHIKHFIKHFSLDLSKYIFFIAEICCTAIRLTQLRCLNCLMFIFSMLLLEFH